MRSLCTACAFLAVLGRVSGLGGEFLCKGRVTIGAFTVTGAVACYPAVTVTLTKSQDVIIDVKTAVVFTGIRFSVPATASLRFTGGTVQFSGDTVNKADIPPVGGALENYGKVSFGNTVTLATYEADSGAAVYNVGTMRFQGATFTGCTASKHGAAYNSGNMTFSGSSGFNDNQVLRSNGAGGGLSNDVGGIITFVEDVTFNRNVAALQGGGVHNLGDIAFNGPTLFSDNTAPNGGGLSNAGTIFFRGNGTFALNTATTSGGGAQFTSGEVTFLDTADFLINHADNNGGGFDMTGGTLTFDGVTTFIQNDAGLLGGGISVGAGSFLAARQGVTFTQNTAQSGGALSNNGNTTISGGTTFMNNTATDMGGGAYNVAQLSLSGAVTYTSNTAASGGGLYAAALSTTTMDGRKIFTSNTATTTGGGLAALGAVTMLGYTEFESNSAQVGGGAYLGVYGSVFDATVFEGNKADKDGGGLVVIKGATFTDLARFANNTAQGMGGAVMASAGQLMFTDITLANNTALDGGALAVLTDSLVVSGVLSATQNTASGRGGAIFFSNPDIIIDLPGAIFTANSASGNGGGGIYAESCSNMTLSWALFELNTAQNGEGGGVYLSNCALNGTALSFSDNTAINGGGLALIGTASGQSSTLDNSTFMNGSAVGGSGGHIYTDGIALRVRNSDFSGGIAQAGTRMDTNASTFSGTNGGSIYCTASSSVDIADTSFEENSAGDAGGAIGGASTCAVTLMNAKFSRSFANCCYFENPITSSGSGKLRCEDASLGDDLSKCCLRNQVWGVSPLTGESACIAFDPAKNNSDPPTPTTPDPVTPDPVTADPTTPDLTTLDPTTPDPPTLSPPTTTTPLTTPIPPTTESDLIDGYWRVPDSFINSSVYSNEARVCWKAEACVGGDGAEEPVPATIIDTTAFCADGYQGPYCATCSNDHVQTLGYTCESCSSTALIVTYVLMGILLLTAITCVTFLTIFLIRSGTSELHPHSKHGALVNRLSRVPWSRLMIALVALQIITLYVDVTGALLPESYQKFLAFMSIVNLDISWMGGFQCIISYGFYASLLLKTLGPFGILAYLSMTYSIAMRDVKRRRKMVVLHEVNEEKVASPNSRTLAKVSKPQVTHTQEERVKIAHLTVVLGSCWVYYTTASSVILQTFPCEELANGDSYLRADMSVSCDTSKHTGFVAYAAIMCLVYPIGIPALFFYLLHHHKHHRGEDDDKDPKQPTWVDAASQFLWKPYTKSAVYWEILECMRRVLLTSVAVLITPGSPSQYSACALFAALYMITVLNLRPHIVPLSTWINLLGSMMVFLSMYLSMNVYLSNDLLNTQPSGRTYLTYSILLICWNIGMVVSAFLAGSIVENLFKTTVTSARIHQKSFVVRPFTMKPHPDDIQRSDSPLAPHDIDIFEEEDTGRRQRKDVEEQDGPALKA